MTAFETNDTDAAGRCGCGHRLYQQTVHIARCARCEQRQQRARDARERNHNNGRTASGTARELQNHKIANNVPKSAARSIASIISLTSTSADGDPPVLFNWLESAASATRRRLESRIWSLSRIAQNESPAEALTASRFSPPLFYFLGRQSTRPPRVGVNGHADGLQPPGWTFYPSR